MAKASTKTVSTNETSDTVTREEFDALVFKNAELTKMLEQLLSKQNAEITTVTMPVDDGSWTLVHLQDCDPRLPDSFTVNGKTHYFTTFGETKKFPHSELGDIVARCRNYFATGILALGKDCERYESELPSDIMAITFPDSFFKSMSRSSDEDFERNISKLTETQILHVANTWKNRYFQNNKEYRNPSKIKILNKLTNGFMKPVLDNMNNG